VAGVTVALLAAGPGCQDRKADDVDKAEQASDSLERKRYAPRPKSLRRTGGAMSAPMGAPSDAMGSALYSIPGVTRPARPTRKQKEAGPAQPGPFRHLKVVKGKRFARMYFKHYGVNPTIDTAEQSVSTFSVDVDTASYELARAYLERGKLPPEAAIRVEEFVNAFDYGYRGPGAEAEHPFSIQAELLPSPHRQGYHVLHLGLQGRKVSAKDRKPANLVFVIDVSGSMSLRNRLGLVKKALGLLTDQLREDDWVSLVVYGSQARVVLEPTAGDEKARIRQAIASLRTGGSTNAGAGIRLGYQQAARHFRPAGINRVILCSDGVANTGVTAPGGILGQIKADIERGITLTAVGFGMGNYNDVLMEQLADKANGAYHYVDRLSQAKRVFVDRLTATLQVIAKDVKVQLQFDPKAVARYRLLGYENRRLSKRDFADDKKDAGEIGAGHAVTALYEVKLEPAGGGAPLGTLRLRYKPPQGKRSRLITRPLPHRVVRARFAQAAPPTQLSVVAAAFAEKLRRSYWVRTLSYGQLLSHLDRIEGPLAKRADVVRLRKLVRIARRLDNRGDKYAQILPADRMDFDRVPVLKRDDDARLRSRPRRRAAR
jgi:Ca-activated chloride channel family protein